MSGTRPRWDSQQRSKQQEDPKTHPASEQAHVNEQIPPLEDDDRDQGPFTLALFPEVERRTAQYRDDEEDVGVWFLPSDDGRLIPTEIE